tara:strand:+ start:4013 stop:5026 length:1014 start_codon:yes stop_codon:yes gene_type:complete
MIVQLHHPASSEVIGEATRFLEALKLKCRTVCTADSTLLVVHSGQLQDPRSIRQCPGVRDVHHISDEFKLVSSQWKQGRSTVTARGVDFGPNHFQFMMGPCSVEGEEQLEAVAKFLKSHDVALMRGGVFKPRSSPYSFRGMGLDGLKLFREVADRHDLGIVTEVMEVAQIDAMAKNVDVFQIGARNMQNFNLLEAVGKSGLPVLLKRSMSGTLEEFLHCAEYVYNVGNDKIMLCERGIRTFEGAYRNTFDVNAISYLQSRSHLPVIADPSHGVGLRRHVVDVGLAAVAAGADGLLVEIHPQPDTAVSDRNQTLYFDQAARLIEGGRQFHALRQAMIH